MVRRKPLYIVLIVILLAGAVTPVFADAPSLELLRTYQRMQYAISAGNIATATELAKEALALGRDEFGKDSADTAALNLSVAELLFEQEELEEAARFYRIALSIEAQLHGPDHPDLMPILQRLAEIAARRSDLIAAEKYLWRAIAIGQAVYVGNHPDVVHGLERLAEVFRAGDRYDEASRLDAQIRDLKTQPTVVDAVRKAGRPRGTAEPGPRRRPLSR